MMRPAPLPGQAGRLALSCFLISGLLISGCGDRASQPASDPPPPSSSPDGSTATDAATPTLDQKQRADRARAFVEALARDDAQAAVEHFDVIMTAMAPPEKLTALWQGLTGQFGAFESITEIREEVALTAFGQLVQARFARSDVELRVAVNATGQIVGFFLGTARARDEAFPRPPYARPDRFKEIELTFGAEQTPLKGTLTLPVQAEGAPPPPALVLVHGSGPHDRDETVGANKPFRDLAWGLASGEAPVAVFRYEKRTFAHPAALAGTPFTVKELVVDDAVAAVEAVLKRPEINSKKVAVLGHSLGAYLVPRIARRCERCFAFFALAPNVTPLEDIIVDQVTHIAQSDGTVSAEEATQIKTMEAARAQVKALTEPAASPLIHNFPPSFWLDLKGYQPQVEALTIKPLLWVIHGDRDYQVTTDKEGAQWAKALFDHERHNHQVLPDLDHLMIPGKGPSTPESYNTPGHVSHGLIQQIGRQLNQWTP